MNSGAYLPAPVPAADGADAQLVAYLNLKLREIGQPGVIGTAAGDGLARLVDHFLALSREKDRALSRHLCPVDQRLQNFLYDQLEAGPDLGGEVPRLPASTLVLDRAGLARVLSLPPGADDHRSAILSSYRVQQGVLHNPKADRRTTQAVSYTHLRAHET